MSVSSSNNSDAGDGKADLYPSLNDLGSEAGSSNQDSDAESARLVYSCSDATLYFISNSGTVTVSSGPDTVRIFEIEDDVQKTLPKYYLQIYTFVYPLVRQVSPCIRTEFGAIVLPNINPDECSADNQSIGLIVPKDHEEEFILILENILGTKIVFCDTRSGESVSKKIADTIVSGAECVSNLLIQGAQKAEQFMDGGTPKIIEKIRPGDGSRRVNPCVKNGIRIARDVTAVTANVTGFVASKVGAATVSLGQFLAPHIRRRGSQLLSQTTGMSENRATEKMDSVLNVTAGAVEGLGTIYGGLEQSACIFGRSLNNNTVQIVQHKYGHSAAEFTQDTFETVSNGIQIGTNIRVFKPKNLTKSAMTGIVISKDNASKSSASVSSSQADGSISNLSLIEVQDNSISSEMSERTNPPAAFSSEILRPTVVSPTYQLEEAVTATELNSPARDETKKEKVDDLMS